MSVLKVPTFTEVVSIIQKTASERGYELNILEAFSFIGELTQITVFNILNRPMTDSTREGIRNDVNNRIEGWEGPMRSALKQAIDNKYNSEINTVNRVEPTARERSSWEPQSITIGGTTFIGRNTEMGDL